MKIYSEADYQKEKANLHDRIRKGAVFIYPTDTIYGIGCDATDGQAVGRIRLLKQRFIRPFSVIAPGRSWIEENFELPPKAGQWLDKLPGPYTLIMKMRNIEGRKIVSGRVNMDMDNLGIRIPSHWSSEIAKSTGLPIVTTSANISGEAYMTSLVDLDPAIRDKVDFIIDAGKLGGRPSTIVDLTKKDIAIVKR